MEIIEEKVVLALPENNLKIIYNEYVRSGYNNLIGTSIDEDQQLKMLIMFLDEADVPLDEFLSDNKLFLNKKRKEFHFSSIEDLVSVYRAKFALLTKGNKESFNLMISAWNIQHAADMLYKNSKSGGSRWIVGSPDTIEFMDGLDD